MNLGEGLLRIGYCAQETEGETVECVHFTNEEGYDIIEVSTMCYSECKETYL